MQLQVLADLRRSIEQQRLITWHKAGSDAKVHAMLFFAIAQLAQGRGLKVQVESQGAP